MMIHIFSNKNEFYCDWIFILIDVRRNVLLPMNNQVIARMREKNNCHFDVKSNGATCLCETTHCSLELILFWISGTFYFFYLPFRQKERTKQINYTIQRIHFQRRIPSNYEVEAKKFVENWLTLSMPTLQIISKQCNQSTYNSYRWELLWIRLFCVREREKSACKSRKVTFRLHRKC